MFSLYIEILNESGTFFFAVKGTSSVTACSNRTFVFDIILYFISGIERTSGNMLEGIDYGIEHIISIFQFRWKKGSYYKKVEVGGSYYNGIKAEEPCRSWIDLSREPSLKSRDSFLKYKINVNIPSIT